MTKIRPLVSVVMPCYNSRNSALKALNSVLNSKYPNFEVIVVDDRSTDGTYDLLFSKTVGSKKVKLVQNDINSGPSATRNRGIKEARGKYVAFIETDMEVESSWLEPLVRTLEKDKRLGAVQSKVLDINKRNTIQTVGVLFDPHTFWVYPPGCGYGKDWLPKNLELGIGAVGSMVRKSVINRIGGFDEKIVHNWDDIELGWRIWLAGYKTKTVPEAITYHWTMKPNETRAKVTSSLMSEFHFHKTPRIFLKNYEWINILRFMPWLYFAYFIRDLFNLTKGNASPIKGLLKSFLWLLQTLPDTLREREKIQQLRRRTDSEMFEKIGLEGSFFDVYLNKIHFNLLRGREAFQN